MGAVDFDHLIKAVTAMLSTVKLLLSPLLK